MTMSFTRLTVFAVTITLIIHVQVVSANVQLFDGLQAGLFASQNITTECDTALNLSVACPETIKYLTYPDHAIGKSLSVVVKYRQGRSDRHRRMDNEHAGCSLHFCMFVNN
jgi:hypothetical protein